MATSASHKVFRIVELAEQILSNLELDDLLNIYRINRSFHNIIKGSSKLQNTMTLGSDHLTNELSAHRSYQEKSGISTKRRSRTSASTHSNLLPWPSWMSATVDTP